jgi:hypothetical protein
MLDTFNGQILFQNYATSSKSTAYFNNLFTYTPAYYFFTFAGIPAGQTVYVKIWIYGYVFIGNKNIYPCPTSQKNAI